MTGWTALIAAHATGATLSLVLGGYLVIRRRKGDRRHRRLGRVWMVAMYWTVISSFWVKELHPGHFSWIHGLSVFTFVTLTVALWAALTGRVHTHKSYVLGSYFGLVGAGIAASAFPQRLVPQLAMHRPLVLVVAVAGVVGVVALLVRGAGVGVALGGAQRRAAAVDLADATPAARQPAVELGRGDEQRLEHAAHRLGHHVAVVGAAQHPSRRTTSR
jgi:uncharacterized membrane protein